MKLVVVMGIVVVVAACVGVVVKASAVVESEMVVVELAKAEMIMEFEEVVGMVDLNTGYSEWWYVICN